MKRRDGFINVSVQIPAGIWAAVLADAEASGESATRALAQALRRHYQLPPAVIPGPRKAGPKRKS